MFNTAMAEAQRLGHNFVGTEHLLVSLVLHREVLPDAVAALLPSDIDALTSALVGLLGGPPPRDAELLTTIGIDLDAVAGSGAGDLRARRNRAARSATGSSAMAAMAAAQSPMHVPARWRNEGRPSRQAGFRSTPVRTPTADCAQPSIRPGYCSGWWKSKTHSRTGCSTRSASIDRGPACAARAAG